MDKKLLVQAFVKFFAGLALVMLLVFLPAGSLKFWNGWLLIGLLFIPMFVAGLILMKKNPALLEKRLNAKEKEQTQRGVVAASGVMFLAGFVVAGLNYRFGWWSLPKWIVILGAVSFLLGYALYAEVLRENTYLSRTVEVQQGQKVIDTGLYGMVRHPMYAATMQMFLAIPLILGSLFALIIFLAYPVIISFRMRNEEEVLVRDLPGYAEYRQRVKYRIFPGLW